jgi:hypothetical protein
MFFPSNIKPLPSSAFYYDYGIPGCFFLRAAAAPLTPTCVGAGIFSPPGVFPYACF